MELRSGLEESVVGAVREARDDLVDHAAAVALLLMRWCGVAHAGGARNVSHAR
jgi:hypothetical protein